MEKYKNFIIKDTTITIDNTTTLQFNSNSCYQIAAPYIFVTAYKFSDYVLLHELQGYETDEVIEPKTSKEFADGLLTMDNPYYVDYYHMLHTKISIESNENGFLIMPNDSFNEDIEPYKGKNLKSFHLFKVDEGSWSETKLDLMKLRDIGFTEWTCFANGMIKK